MIEYRGILDRVHQTVLPNTYLEIGVQHGYTLQLALPCTTAVGVDPKPVLLAALGDNVRVETMTSDDFFGGGHAERAFGSRPIDLAFIDGLHLFEYALRDFCNVERRAHPASVIILDDCLPRTGDEGTRERSGVGWAGDVWRVLACLGRERPDLDITVVRAAPTGLAVIRGLDPESRSFDPTDQEMLDRYLALDFDALAAEILPSLEVTDAEWRLIEPLLPPPMQVIRDVPALLRRRDQTRPDLATLLRRARDWALHTRTGVLLNNLRRSALHG